MQFLQLDELGGRGMRAIAAFNGGGSARVTCQGMFQGEMAIPRDKGLFFNRFLEVGR